MHDRVIASLVEVNRPGEAFLGSLEVSQSVQNSAKQAVGIGVRPVVEKQPFAHCSCLRQAALICDLSCRLERFLGLRFFGRRGGQMFPLTHFRRDLNRGMRKNSHREGRLLAG